MSSPARADEQRAASPTRPATEPKRSSRDHEREQKEHGQGYVQREDILWHLARDPEAKRYFSPGELLVLAALVGIANKENGRCDAKLVYLAKLTNLEHRTLTRILGGSGYRAAIAATGKNPGRALSQRKQPGQLQGLTERVWYSIKAARIEFKEHRERAAARSGRCTTWLKFTTWDEVLAWGKARAEAQPKGRRGAHFRVDRMEPSSEPLNTIHSEDDPEPRVRVAIGADVDVRTEHPDAFQSGSRSTPNGPIHSIRSTPYDPLRTSGSPEVRFHEGSEKIGSSPPPETSPARAVRANDDAPGGARVVAPSAPCPPGTPLTLPQDAATDTSCGTEPTRAIARSSPAQDASVAASRDVAPNPQSYESGRARPAPDRAPLTPAETERLAHIARVFVREYGRTAAPDGRPTFPDQARVVLEARLREAPVEQAPARLEELEDAAYSAGTDEVQAQGVRTPWAFVFSRNCLERRAATGRPRRAERAQSAAAAEARRVAAIPRTLEDLSRDLVNPLEGAPGVGELVDVVVKPVAARIAEHRAATRQSAIAEAATRAAAAVTAATAARGTPRALAAKRDLEAALAALTHAKRAATEAPPEDLEDRRRRQLDDLEAAGDFDGGEP